MHKSYLKYAGGKSKILSTIVDIIHDCDDKYLDNGIIQEYYEPFLGSGVVAMNVNAHDMTLSDINWDVVNCHNVLIEYNDEVIRMLQTLWTNQSVDYDGKYNKDHYMRIRELVNEYRFDGRTLNRAAAMLIYLNKFGFNGMFRYNKKGDFNVPVGGKSGKNPSLPSIPEEDIQNFSNVMKGREIVHADWYTMLSPLVDNPKLEPSVVYIDPPYVNSKGGEIQYSSDGFTLDDQRKLAEFAEQAHENGHRVIISNHDLDFTREIYNNAIRIVELDVQRTISSKGSTRGKAKELVAIYE